MVASAGAVVADGTPDFSANEISKQDFLFPTSLRHARVFSDGTFDFRQSVFEAMKKLPAGQFGFTDNKNIAIVDPMLMSYVQGLNNLQHSSRGQLLAASIAIPTKHWLDFIPPSAEDKIDYLTPHELEFHQLFNRGSGAWWRNTMNNITADLSTMTRLFGSFFEREYSIFNWNTGGHWGSSLIHKQRGKDGRWNRIAHIAVLDPLQSNDTIQFVHARLRAVLRSIGCTIARGEIERTFWFPRQRDGYSCGVYAANLNRILIDRIADLYLPSGPNAYNDAALWQPAREYFDPRQFQGEMQGLVGLTLVRELEYKARLAVAIVDKTTNIAVDSDDYEALAVGPDPTEFSLTRGGKPRPQTRKTTSTQQKATFLEGLGNKISKTLQGKGRKRRRNGPDPTTTTTTTTTTIAVATMG
ncbi:hypothetical protein PG985_010919 [Apiospora marii]|uniref:uncharacterized protein n=1 Tax=Apiospora marii TaxID=335849 RepID=UPI003131D61A